MSSMIKTKVDQQKFEKDLRHKQMIDCKQQGEICLWNFQSPTTKNFFAKKASKFWTVTTSRLTENLGMDIKLDN